MDLTRQEEEISTLEAELPEGDSRATHLVDSWHNSKNGSIGHDSCLDVFFGQIDGHFMTLKQEGKADTRRE